MTGNTQTSNAQTSNTGASASSPRKPLIVGLLALAFGAVIAESSIDKLPQYRSDLAACEAKTCSDQQIRALNAEDDNIGLTSLFSTILLAGGILKLGEAGRRRKAAAKPAQAL